MHRAAHFCVAKVLGGFQQINMLKLTGPIHSAPVCGPSRLSSLPRWEKKKNPLVQKDSPMEGCPNLQGIRQSKLCLSSTCSLNMIKNFLSINQIGSDAPCGGQSSIQLPDRTCSLQWIAACVYMYPCEQSSWLQLRLARTDDKLKTEGCRRQLIFCLI